MRFLNILSKQIRCLKNFSLGKKATNSLITPKNSVRDWKIERIFWDLWDFFNTPESYVVNKIHGIFLGFIGFNLNLFTNHSTSGFINVLLQKKLRIWEYPLCWNPNGREELNKH